MGKPRFSVILSTYFFFALSLSFDLTVSLALPLPAPPLPFLASLSFLEILFLIFVGGEFAVAAAASAWESVLPSVYSTSSILASSFGSSGITTGYYWLRA